MANMCNNNLEFTCKVIPEWFKQYVDPDPKYKPDDYIIVEWESRSLFINNDFDSILANQSVNPSTNYITFSFWFETKWAPPTDLYQMMIDDDNIVSLYAVWYEPGCECLGYANKDQHTQDIVYDDAPEVYYSETLWCEVLFDEPPQSWVDMEWDNYILYKQYLIDMQKEKYYSQYVTFKSIDEELLECKDILFLS